MQQQESARSSRIVSRPRLLDRLREADAQINIIEAPRGFGKTVLLRQWMTEADANTVTYVQVNTRGGTDGDFWSGALDAALAQGAIRQADGDDQESFGRWAEQLSHPVTVVVDGYEKVTSPRLDEEWTRMLQRAPKLRLLVASRFLSGLGGPLSSATLTTARLSAADLRLTEDEVTDTLQAWA